MPSCVAHQHTLSVPYGQGQGGGSAPVSI